MITVFGKIYGLAGDKDGKMSENSNEKRRSSNRKSGYSM